MVNTIDTTQASPYIPEIWANEGLPVLRSNIVVARLVARDTEYDSFRTGDILNIPYPGTMTASDKSAGTAHTLAQPTGETSVAVTLDKHKSVSFLIEDIVEATANASMVRRYANGAMEALAAEIEDSLIALFAGFSGTVGAYGTDLDAADVLASRKKLNDAKAPSNDRHIVFSTKDELTILGDSALASYNAFANPEAIAAGAIGDLYGIRCWTSNRIATNAVPAPDETVNAAFHRDAMILAMRDLPAVPAGLGATSATVRDPETGIQFRVVMAYDASYGGTRVTYEALWGVKELRDALGVLVKS